MTFTCPLIKDRIALTQSFLTSSVRIALDPLNSRHKLLINMHLPGSAASLRLMLRGEQMEKPKVSLSRAARELGRRGGLATAARTTPEQLRARARKGGLARARAKKEALHA